MCCNDHGKSRKRVSVDYIDSEELPTVTTVCVDGLEETKRNPDVDSENVQVMCVPAVQDGSSNCTSAKDENLSRVGIFSSKAERC
jgi:hypothetical protein